MILPVQVTFRNVDPTERVQASIQAHAQKLEKYCGPITRCRVLVEAPARHRAKGNLFHVRIDLTLPGGEIVVRHTPDARSELTVLQVAISKAFDSARRRLQDHARLRRSDVKTHVPTPQARVTKLFPGAGYGYMETVDGREVYFHANSVIGDGFDKLKLGAKVSFVEETGEKGPQASTVKLARRARPIPATLPITQASRNERKERGLK